MRYFGIFQNNSMHTVVQRKWVGSIGSGFSNRDYQIFSIGNTRNASKWYVQRFKILSVKSIL